MPLRRGCLLIYLLFTPFVAFSQNMRNLHIERVQDDGLTNEVITCINQDANGFMWFGTTEGLFRYDAYGFKAFRNIPGDSTTLANNIIVSLYAEKNNLWVGTLTGLSCIDINTHLIRNFSPVKPLQINTILPKDNATLWIATSSGFYEFNKNNHRFMPVPAASENMPVSYATDDHNGHLYLSSFNGIYRYTIASGISKFYYFDIPEYPKLDKSKKTRLNISASVLDRHGNLWMSSFEAGLVRFNTKTEKVDSWSHPTYDVHFLPFITVAAVLPDKFGNIWLANKDGGLNIFNPSKNEFVNYPVEWKSENKISDAVISLFRDRLGIVWIGTENGIFKYDPHHVYLAKTDLFLKTDTGLSPAHFSPLTMFKDRDGLWWLGSFTGVYTLDEKTGAITDGKDKVGFANQPFYAVFNITQDKNGIIWLSANNLLVKVTKSPGGIYKSEIFRSDEIKSKILALYIDDENNIWLGTHSDGFFRFDPSTKKIISCHYNEIGPESKIKEIRTFYKLSKDSLLVGGFGTGLLLLHINTGKLEKINLASLRGVSDNVSVNAIYRKGDDLWIGTEPNGLLQLSTDFKKRVNITSNDGLPSMVIDAIRGDAQNNLWLLTNSGVVRFQTITKKITVFDKRDGIQDLNKLNAVFVDNNDRVSVAGRGAIYNFDQSSVTKNNTPPEVSITGMRVFDKDYLIQKSDTINLEYDQNYFSFDYVALNYTQSRLNKYAYKMAGLDKNWNYAGSNRHVSYANLKEGTYTFNVKACNNEGVWNNVPATLVLIIQPPFWHRWWFFSLLVLIVAVVLYAIYVYNINQLKIRLQMRDKIASDLHDDIGSTLSGINIFSKIALQQMQPGQPGQELVEKISDRSKKTMDALSDIVWSINTRNDGMDNFLVKAREYFSVLDAQDIAYDFTVSDDIAQLKIGMIQKNELYLIFKEAICNASKYAQCSFVQVSLTRHKDICTLYIGDNGKGFNVDSVSSGNGIYNMQRRAKKMNAEFEIDSQRNKGTTVMLKFKITQYR